MQTSYGYLCFFVAVFLLELLDAASSVNGLLLSSIKWMTARTYFNVQDIFTDSRASIKGVATTTNNFCVVVFWVNICFHGYSQKMLIVKFYGAEVYLLRREPAREFRCQVSTISYPSSEVVPIFIVYLARSNLDCSIPRAQPKPHKTRLRLY